MASESVLSRQQQRDIGLKAIDEAIRNTTTEAAKMYPTAVISTRYCEKFKKQWDRVPIGMRASANKITEDLTMTMLLDLARLDALVAAVSELEERRAVLLREADAEKKKEVPQ